MQSEMSFIQRLTIECNGTLSREQSFLSTDVRIDTMQRSLCTAEEQLGLSSFKLCIFMTRIWEESVPLLDVYIKQNGCSVLHVT